MKLIFSFAFAATVALASLARSEEPDGRSHKLASVSLRKMADSLRAIIVADQRAYAGVVEERSSAAGTNSHLTGLPSHAQLLRAASADIQRRGAEFSYALRSLWPMDPRNGPQTEREESGMKAVAKAPDEGYYADEMLGGRSYFTAIYADRAVLHSCVDCHNRDSRSSRSDFKTNDVIGALVIRIPLEF